MFQIKRKKPWPRIVIISSILLAIVITGVYGYQRYVGKTTGAPTQPTIDRSVDLPAIVTSDKTPEVKREYAVAPDRPRHLKIDRIGVDANILPMGITASGAMEAPATAWDVGWYNQSALPGSGSGALLLDGHVNNTIGTPGIFYRLHSLKQGDAIQLERGDGTILTFEVMKVEQKSIEQVDMAAMLRSVLIGKQGLNIITCGGTYDADRKTYDQRVLVYAVHVE